MTDDLSRQLSDRILPARPSEEGADTSTSPTPLTPGTSGRSERKHEQNGSVGWQRQLLIYSWEGSHVPRNSDLY